MNEILASLFSAIIGSGIGGYTVYLALKQIIINTVKKKFDSLWKAIDLIKKDIKDNYVSREVFEIVQKDYVSEKVFSLAQKFNEKNFDEIKEILREINESIRQINFIRTE